LYFGKSKNVDYLIYVVALNVTQSKHDE